MNLLVIGNGFDIALGLPTKYTDFLDFVQAFDTVFGLYMIQNGCHAIEDAFKSAVKGSIPDADTRHIGEDDRKFAVRIFKKFEKCITDPFLARAIEDFYKCLHNHKNMTYKNCWIQYFQEKRDGIPGKKWIDIENEIKKVIRFFETNEAWGAEGFSKYYDKLDIVALMDTSRELQAYQEEDCNLLAERLHDEFDYMVLALGIYLDFFVKNIDVSKTLPPEINDFISNSKEEMKHIISFNYIDNITSFADNKNNISICFIHGRVNYMESIQRNLNFEEIRERNNIVIGFEEYLDDEDTKIKLDFLQYRKYEQCARMNTDTEYMNWLNGNTDDFIYIFGHSIGETDKEFFTEIFEGKEKIIIYYHDESSHEQIIKNLVHFLGRKKFQEKIKNKSLELILQQDENGAN